MHFIELRNISKIHGFGEGRVCALSDISLAIDRGEFVAIMGQSGSGKSSLLNIIGCLDTPTAGEYFFDGIDTKLLNRNEIAQLRNLHFGFIFQHYNLISTLSVLDNVALPAVYAGTDLVTRCKKSQLILTQLDIRDKIEHFPNQLSGGQQQRVSIARAIINKGELILADEPTGALDSVSGKNVLELLTKLNNNGHTIILITHDINIARHANRIIEIKDGKLVSNNNVSYSENNVNASHISKQFLYISQAISSFVDLRHYTFSHFLESFRMAMHAICMHKLRSLLTMLGIVIGIASVVFVIALGESSKQKILADIQSLGTNTLTIYPGISQGDLRTNKYRPLSVSDAAILSKQAFVAYTSPMVSASGTLVFGHFAGSTTIVGVSEPFFNVRAIEIAHGRFFDSDDIKYNKSVAVLDHATNQLIFKGDNSIGNIVLLNKTPVKIIGIAKKNENYWHDNSVLNIWTPYTTTINKITGQPNLTNIIIRLNDNANPKWAEEEVRKVLDAKNGTGSAYYIINSDSIKKTIEKTTNTMTIFVFCIAVISLIVGGIGIMNIMLVSVTERTNEIGIRLAVGARPSYILEQFLIESVIVSSFGGIIGLFVAFLCSWTFNQFVSVISTTISFFSIIIAFGCSTIVGIVFGILPARNASLLTPVKALARD